MKLDKENSWESLAAEYNFKLEDRNSFKRARIQPNEWSPTRAVLKRLTEKCPGSLLEEFKSCLRKMQRNDLAIIIEKFIEDYKLQQLRERHLSQVQQLKEKHQKQLQQANQLNLHPEVLDAKQKQQKQELQQQKQLQQQQIQKLKSWTPKSSQSNY